MTHNKPYSISPLYSSKNSCVFDGSIKRSSKLSVIPSYTDDEIPNILDLSWFINDLLIFFAIKSLEIMVKPPWNPYNHQPKKSFSPAMPSSNLAVRHAKSPPLQWQGLSGATQPGTAKQTRHGDTMGHHFGELHMCSIYICIYIYVYIYIYIYTYIYCDTMYSYFYVSVLSMYACIYISYIYIYIYTDYIDM